MPYPDAYIPLYNASALAVKSVDPILKVWFPEGDFFDSLQVGGPATMQVQHIADFIADTQRMKLPVDFVSTHLYPSDPNCTTGAGKNDPDCWIHTVIGAYELARDADLQFLMTEYNDGLQGGPGYGHGGMYCTFKSFADLLSRSTQRYCLWSCFRLSLHPTAYPS